MHGQPHIKFIVQYDYSEYLHSIIFLTMLVYVLKLNDYIDLKLSNSSAPQLNVLTYLLTPCRRAPLEKLMSTLSVKKFPAFYGTWRLTAVFTCTRHLSLSWARSIQFMLPHPNSRRSILILSSHLHLGFTSCLFPARPTKTLYTPLISPICATCPGHLILLDLITWIIFGEEYISLSSPFVVLSTPLLPHPLRPKYSPQHPILNHPLPTFLPHCEQPSFTPIQDNRKNCSSIHHNLYIFG